MELTLTDSAKQKIASLILDEPDSFLRLSIQGGGCAGFSYNFLMDSNIIDEEDLVHQEECVKFVIDAISHDLVKGSQIDYTDDLMWSGFIVKNPNAVSKCGCGTSFSI